MSGHGHVIPNADGSKARCGGPGICILCSIEESKACLLPGCRHVDTDCPQSLTYVRPKVGAK